MRDSPNPGGILWLWAARARVQIPPSSFNRPIHRASSKHAYGSISASLLNLIHHERKDYKNSLLLRMENGAFRLLLDQYCPRGTDRCALDLQGKGYEFNLELL